MGEVWVIMHKVICKLAASNVLVTFFRERSLQYLNLMSELALRMEISRLDEKKYEFYIR